MLVREQHLGQTGEPTLRDLSQALIAVWETDYGLRIATWIARFTDVTGRQRPTGTDACCWPATPRTCTRPRAARA